MDIVPYSNEIDEYLKADDVIDFKNKSIMQLADGVIRMAYYEVRKMG